MNQGLGEVQMITDKIIINISHRSAPNIMFMQRHTVIVVVRCKQCNPKKHQILIAHINSNRQNPSFMFMQRHAILFCVPKTTPTKKAPKADYPHQSNSHFPAEKLSP